MSFKGQINFGYPITSHNIITDIPDNAVLPLSIGSSLQGNTLGVSFGDLKSQVASPLYDAYRNTFVGKNAFNSIVNPENTGNVAIGDNVLKDNIGARSVGIGSNALSNNTTGFQNIAVGASVLFRNVTGENNTALGSSAMYYNTTGSNNIAIGALTMYFNTTGSYNTSIGLSVTPFATIGSNNTAVGAQIDYGNFNSCVLLGRQAQPSGNNQFVVGSSSYNAGAIATEALTPTKSWTIRINGVNYKIPLQLA